jgi:hypothetical protein
MYCLLVFLLSSWVPKLLQHFANYASPRDGAEDSEGPGNYFNDGDF